MAAFSLLRNTVYVALPLCKGNNPFAYAIRNSGSYDPRKMNIRPTSWQFQKFKDCLHFYFMIGVVPLTALVTYVNITIGPAQLRPIPEDYTPKHWEYYKHPICRWFARYVYRSHQEEYERFLHYIYEQHEKQAMKVLTHKVSWLRKNRVDSEDSVQFRRIPLDYMLAARKEDEFKKKNYGDDY